MTQEELKEYLNSRSISDDIIKEFNIHIGTFVNAKGTYRKECVVIPITNPHREIIFNKYRRLPSEDNTDTPKYMYDSGATVSLFGIEQALRYRGDVKEVIVTEGEFDALVLWSLGQPAVSSTGGCSTFKDEWFDLLLSKYERVIICFDNDEPGQREMAKIAKRVLNIRIFVSLLGVGIYKQYPCTSDGKDITDYSKNTDNLVSLIKENAFNTTHNRVLNALNTTRCTLWADPVFFDKYFEVPPQKTREKFSYVGAGNDATKIERARSIPIESMVQVDGYGRFKCLWHNDHNPSMKLYDNNTAYCFACPKYADAIDIFMKINNCSFKEALDRMQ